MAVRAGDPSSTLLTRPPVLPGADVLSATDTLGQALTLGLIRADDVLTGRVWVVDASASHRVHLVGTGAEASMVVKTPGSVSVLDGDDPVRTERAALRHLAGSGLTPRLLLEGAAGHLWTAAVPGEVLAAQGAASTPAGEPFTAWGATLAALHRLPVRGGEPVAPLPWVLALPFTAPGHLGGRGTPAAVREVLAQVQERTVLADALRDMAGAWRRAGWCHGDATPANAIVQSPMSVRDVAPVAPEGCTVVLVDLEHAGLGDPDWDLATALDGIDTITGDATLAESRRARLLSGYREAGGPGRENPRFLAARAVLSAVRHAIADAEQGVDAPCGPGATAALDRAEALASAPCGPTPAARPLARRSWERP